MNSFYQSLRETFRAFVPTPESVRKEFLGKFRKKVDYYKPRIEERCKVSLGEVLVKDNREWLYDKLFDLSTETAIQNAQGYRRSPCQTDFNYAHLVAFIARGFLIPTLWFSNNFGQTDYRQSNGVIYVPFYYANRKGDLDFKLRELAMDTGVVHELSHVLWEKISGRKDIGLKGRSIWFEGFATYCENNYFQDFYLNNIRTGYSGVYKTGMERVEEAVKRHGENILLQVPKRWEEFEKERSQLVID